TAPVSGSTVVTSVSCFGGSNGSINLTPAGGTPGYTFNWGGGITTEDRTGLTAGTYTVIITDANGCTGTVTATVNSPAALVASAGSQTNVSCFGGSNGSATVSVTGGTPGFSYSWSPSGGTAAMASGLSAGTYTVTVTDNNGCTATQAFTITQPAAALMATSASQTNVSCFGGSNGAASVSVTGGTPGFSYSWSPSGGTSATASGLNAGTYTVTVTDANGCTATQSFTITEPAAPLMAMTSSTTILCNGGTSDITVSAMDGTAPYTGTGIFTVNAGTYTYTVTDANGCSANSTITVSEPIALMAMSSATTISCFGGTSNVTVSAMDGTAPYSGTGTFTVTAGTYTYTVTDANGCSTTTTITVTEPSSSVTAMSSATTILCNGGTSDVTVTGTGGTAPYTGTGIFTVNAGTFNYMVTDANGCSSTTSITITEPTAVAASSNSTTIMCNGETSDVTVSATGGTGTLTGTGVFTVSAGTYTYTVTDANGCSATTTITISEPALIASTSTPTICAGDSIMVGTSIYSTSGSYMNTLTAANGCDSIVTTNLTVSPAITNSQTITICSGNSITVGSSVYNATGTYSDILTAMNGCDSTVTTNLTVSPAITSTQSFTICAGNAVTVGTSVYNATGTYTDMLTTSAGCDSTVTTNLTVNPLPAVSMSAFNPNTVCFQTPGVPLNGGSPAGGVYSGPGVLPGMFNPSLAGVGPQTITYTITDANSCSNSDSEMITVLDCTGIEEALSAENATVYPNPSTGNFNIHILNVTGKMVISISDAQGKEVYSSLEKLTGDFNKNINLDGFAKGMYAIKLSTENNVIIKKVIID
ncbi:MAG: T9SS type A sorting domain-containing protein, partial [Bacteroidota bacterium]|nr:T9SS type A sorting domain-containing protein [Bacteroidota bacterium]